jgi:hypothetical protein
MPSRILERIRDKIQQRQYDMTAHAMEEMAEDDLDIVDVEHSILGGSLVRIDRDDPRGTRYVINGMAVDEMTPVGTAGRFASTARYLIIPVYEVTNANE